MKRHSALRSLSSDHHRGLVMARRLLKAAQSEPPEEDPARLRASRAFLQFWHEHTVPHFREEEELLLPALFPYAEPSHPTLVRLLVEHTLIRKLADDLLHQVEAGRPSPSIMQALGTSLHDHIRFEEQVLFPLVEEAMPEEALVELARQLGGGQQAQASL